MAEPFREASLTAARSVKPSMLSSTVSPRAAPGGRSLNIHALRNRSGSHGLLSTALRVRHTQSKCQTGLAAWEKPAQKLMKSMLKTKNGAPGKMKMRTSSSRLPSSRLVDKGSYVSRMVNCGGGS